MVVKYGVTRTVYVFKHFVVKIPNCTNYYTFLCGLRANQSEYNWWISLKKTQYEKLIAKVFFNLFGFLLIMKKADDVFRYYEHKDWEVHKIDYKNITTDIKSENFGTIDGRLVLVDYA